MAAIEPVESTLLVTPLQTLNSSPHFLSSPISFAASKTLKCLRIVLVSPLFNPPSKRGVSRTEKWDEVQRLLTYVYVQATKVAQELGRVLMDIDVLLQAENEPIAETLGSDAQRIFRVSLAGNRDGLESLPRSVLDRSADTMWLAPTVYHTPPTPIDSHPHTPLHPIEGDLPPLFPVTALGGTFDHLHAGHKILLSMAAWITSEKLIVGMTDDALLKNKANKHVLEHLPKRTERTRAFLTLFKPSVEYDIVPINDVYGPTAWDPNIQALVVSKETLSGGAAIAKHRKEKNLPSLRTFVIDVISSTEANLDAADAEALKKTKMSSTFIREWIVEQQKKGVQVE
ncbi:Nucleotidylyl transferase [Cristinia sonorae]|uniref:Nucleotidylyl transferase n=1 Tax=Cristinia sonorae TaxID=1940300 RepID=A0A8K0UWN0_9AGAR|nr:Nucleotidylyl transferase [Cristinia sonorae]